MDSGNLECGERWMLSMEKGWAGRCIDTYKLADNQVRGSD